MEPALPSGKCWDRRDCPRLDSEVPRICSLSQKASDAGIFTLHAYREALGVSWPRVLPPSLGSEQLRQLRNDSHDQRLDLNPEG